MSWCVVGVYRGLEREMRYRLAVTAGGDELTISIHVYGADIERLGSSIHRRFDDLEPLGPPPRRARRREARTGHRRRAERTAR